MSIINLAHEHLRLDLAPAFGAGVLDFSIRSPAGEWTPIFRRTSFSPTYAHDLSLFLMGPWTNRIRNAAFTWEGQPVQLRPDHPDGTAIHGDLRHRPFQIRHRSPLSAVLDLDSRSHPDFNWPWPVHVTARYELFPEALSIELAMTNLAPHPVPMGSGFHPYFMRHLWAYPDTPRIHLASPLRYPCRDCLPIGPAAPDALCATLDRNQPLPHEALDDVFRVARPEATIDWPASNLRMRLRSSESSTHAVIYAPHVGPHPAPWFCLEPTTMVNDGFHLCAQNTPLTGVQIVPPGATLTIATEFHVEHLQGSP
jgi:aldose 1-epimerase